MSSSTTPPLRGTPPAEGKNSPSPKGWQAQPDGVVPQLRFPEFRDAGEWDSDELGNVADFVNEKVPVEQIALENYVSTENILRDYGGIARASKLPSTGAVTRFRPNDTLVSNIRPYLKKVWVADKDGGASNDVIVIRAKQQLLTQYFPFLLKNDAFIDYVMAGAKGVKMPRGDIGSMKEYPAFYPSKPEQQKIADCLASLDERITLEAQKLDTLKTHKKGLMQQLFPAVGETLPKLRFPEFREAGEWEAKPFDELFTIGNGKDYKHLSNGDVPVYGSGGYMLSVNDYLHDGESVCIGRKGTINNPMFLTGKFWTVDTLFYTHSFNDCLPRFIYSIFQNIDWIKHNEAGGVPSLSKTNIGKIKVAVPKPKEQQKIADCLTSIDERITLEAQKLDTLKTHKKGLMQQLFPAVGGVPQRGGVVVAGEA
jgi:type I restriction enzyme S subunit